MNNQAEARQKARQALLAWQTEISDNCYTKDTDYQHTIGCYFKNDPSHQQLLNNYGAIVVKQLEPLVNENNLNVNLPRLEAYSSIGDRIDHVVHHPAYVMAGDYIYQTKMLEKMAQAGGLLACLSLFLLSSQAGEAGHHCPIACSAGMIRLFQHVPDFPGKQNYIEQLTKPTYSSSYTGAQFLTELQGGSDVGANAVQAEPLGDHLWSIMGEKWFCSNVGANLWLVTARHDSYSSGTKGLGLFLVPTEWEGKKNNFYIRRLKDKLGTRSMATGEVDLMGAYAYVMGDPTAGIHLVLDHVLHISRLFNAFCVLGMARRALSIAHAYAKHRQAFGESILQYPLVRENLAIIKAENTAMIAAAFAVASLQDQYDLGLWHSDENALLLRLLVNIQKSFTAKYAVQHTHHALDILAGNGAIESFSSIPRLFRDCIVCENWEGTHYVLQMQVLRDMLRYRVDMLYFAWVRQKLAAMNITKTCQPLLKALTQLETDCENLRKLDEAEQSLQMSGIIEKMSVIFTGLMLLIEAEDMQRVMHSKTKQDCYDLFCRRHLAKYLSETDADLSYLDLITRMVQ